MQMLNAPHSLLQTSGDGSYTYLKSPVGGHVATVIPDWQDEYIDYATRLQPEIPTDFLEASDTVPTPPLSADQAELWQRMADDITRQPPTSPSNSGPDVG